MKDGKLIRNTKDSAKNTSSLRTFPLVEPIEKILKRKKQENQIQRKLCGKNYSTEYLDYVNVDEFGQLIKPGYISKTFKKVLAKNNLRHIRYHDLRHSCATLLYDDGRDLKEIQVWHLPDTEQMPYEKRYTIPDVLYKPLNVLRLACG